MIGLVFLLSLAWSAPCTAKGLADIEEAIPQVDRKQHVPMVSHGLALACTGPVALALDNIQSVSPRDYRILDAQLVLAAPHLFMAKCEGGLKLAAKVPEVAASEKRALLFDGCGLDGSVVSRKDFIAGDGLLFAPVIAMALLEQSGASRAQTKLIVGALAGAGAVPSRQDEPYLDPFIEMPSFEAYEPPPPSPRDAGGGGGAMGGLGGVGPRVDDVASPKRKGDGEAGFDDRVAPDWGRKARKEGGVCVAEVEVSRRGEYLGVAWRRCPDALRRDVDKALEASTFWAAQEGKGPRHFVARWRVPAR